MWQNYTNYDKTLEQNCTKCGKIPTFVALTILTKGANF